MEMYVLTSFEQIFLRFIQLTQVCACANSVSYVKLSANKRCYNN